MADPEEGPPRQRSAAAKATVVTGISGATALYLFCLFLASLRSECDVPLKWWILGAALFSIPATYVADQIKRTQGFKATLWFEISLLVIGFIWMGIGTFEVNLSTTCETTAPVLWWTAFVTVVIFWSCAVGGIFFLLVIVLVPMLLSGGKVTRVI